MLLLRMLFRKVYSNFLKTYPRVFREEFQEEMQQVFLDLEEGVESRSPTSLIGLYIRELYQLFKGAVQEHLALHRGEIYLGVNRGTEALVWEGLYMSKLRERDRWLVFLGWVILSTTSILLGFLLLRILINPSGGKGNPVVDAIYGIFAFGVVLPLAQWIIVRQFFPNAIRWLLVSLTGLLIGAGFDLALATLGFYPIQLASSIGMAIIFGAVVGSAQWLFLRQYAPRAIWWIPACAIGWGLMTLMTGRIVEGWFERLLFGLIPAIITGVALVYLLSIPHHGSPIGEELTS